MDQDATLYCPGHIALDGTQLPPKGAQPPIFGPCLLWPNGPPSKLLMNTCFIRDNEKYATRILVCVIAVSKSQEFLLKVRRLFLYFFDVDAAFFTSTRRIFRRRRKGFYFDDKSMFFFDFFAFLAIFCVPYFQRAACSTFQTCILNSH